MSEAAEFPVADFQIERPDSEVMPKYMFCSDDRYNEWGVHGWQYFGGPDGAGRVYVTAKEIDKPGSFVDDGTEIHLVGVKFANELRRLGTRAFMHDPCAAYKGALAIRRSHFEASDEVYQAASQTGIEISELEYEQAAEASQRIVDARIIVPTIKSDIDIQGGVLEKDLHPVGNIPLADMDHVANDIVVDQGTNAYWDSKKAHEAGHPAYYLGVGIWREVAKAMKLDVTPASLSIATAAHIGAVSINLPQPDGKPLNIHAVDE